MNKLALSIGYKVLRRRAKNVNRDKSVQNFDTANSAVIIFDVQIAESFNAIKDFSKYLESRKIKTSVVGFSTDKEPPEKLLLWPNFNIITKKEVNWFGKPKGDIADSYFSKSPDILFVFNTRPLLPIDFMTSLSTARFKVGYFTEIENDLDLMINPVGHNEDISYFIEQVKNYLQMLNPSN